VSICKQIPNIAANATINAQQMKPAKRANAAQLVQPVRPDVMAVASICKPTPTTAANATTNAAQTISVQAVNVPAPKVMSIAMVYVPISWQILNIVELAMINAVAVCTA
jgi:hypothetical protein